MKVDRTMCRHEGQVVKLTLRVTKMLFQKISIIKC